MTIPVGRYRYVGGVINVLDAVSPVHVSRKLREAAKIVEIELLDHVIVGGAKADPLGRGVYSFREGGLL